MRLALKILFASIFVFMVGITVQSSLSKNVLDGFQEMRKEPWAMATLADAYCGFLTFFAWVYYKERSSAMRAIWFVAIILLGNIAMSFYVLRELFRLPADAAMEDRKKGGYF